MNVLVSNQFFVSEIKRLQIYDVSDERVILCHFLIFKPLEPQSESELYYLAAVYLVL